jgi:hypothetical protein
MQPHVSVPGQDAVGAPQQTKRVIVDASEMTPAEPVGDHDMSMDNIASANLRYLDE